MVGCFLAALSAAANAQTQPYPGRGPDQPVQPQVPQFRQRAAQPQSPQQQNQNPQQQPVRPLPRPPFTLTPQQEAQVDQVLNLWEQRNRNVKTFDCRFKRWSYDIVTWESGPRLEQPKPTFIETGTIKYAAPDRGMYCLETTEVNGREEPIGPNQAEKWICDGRSVFKYDFKMQQLIEYKLPPEMQGKAIADGPLPFLFNSEARKLKERYLVRLITPADVRGEIWLEAYPRHQQDAANFHHVWFIVNEREMLPHALRIIEPDGKNYKVYQFFDVVVNDPLKFFKGDPFRASLPHGWTKSVEEPPAAEARRAPPPAGRR
jgi:TIGR03009 family protein